MSGTYSNALTFSSASNSFTGSGAGLTGLSAGSLSSGTLPDARLSGTYTGALTLSNASNSFTGSGAGLTALNATNLASGTVPSARISGTYSNALTFSSASNSFTGNGAGLTALTPANISSGTAGINISGSAATAATATNALSLGGVAASGYVLKAGDTMSGTLNLPADGLVAGTNQLVLTGGKVGIGTASPAHNFHVVTNTPSATFWFEAAGGSADPELRVKADSGHAAFVVDRSDVGSYAGITLMTGGVTDWSLATVYTGDTSRLQIAGQSGEVMTLKQSGNVGIGTVSPGQKLSVAGTVESTSGGFKFPDGTTQTTASTGGGTATDLNCTSCVSSSEVDFNYAGSSSKGGAATSAVAADTATNALSLGGVTASSYARVDAANTFSSTNTFTGEVTFGAGGISHDGAGLKHSRGALILSAGAQGTTQLTWSTAFADASYTATCQALDGAAGITGLKVIRIQSITASSITVVVQNDSGSDRTGQLHCIAIHD